jgi:hypothetical protein
VADDALSLPALYVTDAQEPRVAARVGANAVTVRATGASQGTLTIDAASVTTIDAATTASRLLVVVVDP